MKVGHVKGSLVERSRENLADSTRNVFKNLYRNRLGGPIACHVLVQNSRFLKIFFVEIGPVFPQPLYKSPLGPLGFEGAQHRQTLRPSVDGVRSKAPRPFGKGR